MTDYFRNWPAIYPVFDGSLGPGLSYKVLENISGDITILGEHLARITVVDVSVDVNVAGNSGLAPDVGVLVVTDTSITVPLSWGGGGASQGDEWGVMLRDAAGNSFAAPSPLTIGPGL